MPFKDPAVRTEYQKQYRTRNGEQAKTNWRKWRDKNPARRALHQRKYGLKRKGLTLEQFEELSEKQKGLCFICHQKPKGKLNVDHCHATNTFRGLLCRGCNAMIGRFRDKPAAAQRLLEYLEANSLFSCNGH